MVGNVVLHGGCWITLKRELGDSPVILLIGSRCLIVFGGCLKNLVSEPEKITTLCALEKIQPP